MIFRLLLLFAIQFAGTASFWTTSNLNQHHRNVATIVNGNRKPIEPNLGEFPFQANLMIRSGGGKAGAAGGGNSAYQSFCGGSLIHPQWVLTAAHCLEQDGQQMPPNSITVSLGTVYRSGKGGQMIQSERLAINPNYFKTGRHDVGLIKLKTPARLDFYQTPQRLRKANLHIAQPDKCRMNQAEGVGEVCAESTIAEGKACKGDSGGPLTIQKNARYIQVGITSHLAILPFCRISFNNSVYTRVSAYIAWIAKITGIDFTNYNPAT